ncbi:MAG TPA: hypothetical protein VGP47_00705 [Parachlamydiaceae bacterium]|nr:hypothetical protein [Parachlamydiaceae bacterium]
MSLHLPLNTGNKPGTQIGQNISDDNLNVLLNAKSKEDVSTNTAMQAFKEYQEAKVGIGHHIRKYTVSVAAYGTMVVVPVAAVGAGAYWLLQDFINDPFKIFPFVYNNFNVPMIAGSSIPMIGDSIAGSAASALTTPAGTAVSLITVNAIFYKTLGIAPIASVAQWGALMISSALLFAAKQAGDIVARSYDTDEVAKNETRQKTQKTILNELKVTFDDVAKGFINEWELAKDSPKKMLELIYTAEQMQSQLPTIKNLLRKMELPLSNVDMIMTKLQTVVNTVKKSSCDLRSPDQKGAHKYNTELLSIISDKDFTSKAVSKEVKKHVDIVSKNTLGKMHTIESYFAAGVSGVVNGGLVSGFFAAVPNLFLYATQPDSQCYNAQTTSLSNCKIQATAGALSLIPGIVSGVRTATSVQNVYIENRKVADKRRIENTDLALTKLINTYNGIAENLKQQYVNTKNNPQKRELLARDAENILAKIPMIKQEILNTGVIENANLITEELEIILAIILNRAVSQVKQENGNGVVNSFVNFFTAT